MDDDLLNPPLADLPASAPKADDKSQIDPKLLTKALNKMRGLIKGNGLSEDKVTLADAVENTDIRMYRFKARTSLRLVPQYGSRTEPGRNTLATVVPNDAEFKKEIAQIAIDARTNPYKRKQLIDFMFARTDKGFGVKEQRVKLTQLSRDFVQHEKCQTCANQGKLMCTKCHGKAYMPCTKCHGRKLIMCPKCRGTAKVHAGNKMIPCQFCRADGRISCTLCAARGQIKCQNCAATGSIACRVCAASGWLSHLSHVEMFGQIHFDYDRMGLPLTLVNAIDRNPSRCVEKHDVEVTIIKAATDNSLDNLGMAQNHIQTNNEPEDTIWIDYEAMSPFGHITFKINEEEKNGYLFGFQTRLLNFPFFMDDLIQSGSTALKQASIERKAIRPYLAKAAKYRLIRDVIAQTLWIKNTEKTKRFLKDKYPTGLNPDTVSYLVDLTDSTLRNITRLWRTIGFIIGFALFAIILEIYFISDGREYLKTIGLPEMILVLIDILMFPLGIVFGVFGSKFTAKWSQDKMLAKIVPDDILQKTLPKAGKTVQWSMVASAIMIGIILILTVMNGGPIPAWLNSLTTLILSITHAG